MNKLTEQIKLHSALIAKQAMGSFQFPNLLVKLQKKLFINCSHGFLHVRNVKFVQLFTLTRFDAVYNM